MAATKTSISDQIKASIALMKSRTDGTPLYVPNDEVEFIGMNSFNPSKSYWKFAILAGEGGRAPIKTSRSSF